MMNQPADITNRSLYLNYVQQVLKNKENDLITLEKMLTKKEIQLNEIQYKKGVGQMIIQMEEIKLIERKLKHMQMKMGIRDQEYLSLYKKFEDDCTKCKIQMENSFKKQYSDLMNERKILRTKLNQFAELQSYQKYLNQLHEALQLKSQQLAERQSILEQSQIQQKNEHLFTSERARENCSSNRKRVKIFNTKLHGFNEEQQSESNQYFQNETFSKNTPIPGINQINESSAIMAEDSKIDQHRNSNNIITVTSRENISFREQSSSKENSQEIPRNIYEHPHSRTNDQVIDATVQTYSQNIEQTTQRLRKQALIIKYAAKWIKNTIYSQKCPFNKKKTIAMDLWRLNATFDYGISQKVKQNLTALQNLWKKQQKILYETKMFPYNQLSLKRRNYAELMFDLQQKVFHRKKVQTLLKSILVNKHRKERLVFYLYFCRFVKNSFNTQRYRALKQKTKFGQTQGTATGIQSNSQLVSITSSHIRNEQKINMPNKKSAASLPTNEERKVNAHTKNQSQSISKQSSSQHLPPPIATNNKQNSHMESKKQEKENGIRIKQILTEKEKTEKLLATQCVKLEGLIKMSLILVQSTFRTTNYAMKQLQQIQYNTKLNELTAQLNGIEFKFDLVMTKCRLGLANNSNKISTLENLLDFTNLIK